MHDANKLASERRSEGRGIPILFHLARPSWPRRRSAFRSAHQSEQQHSARAHLCSRGQAAATQPPPGALRGGQGADAEWSFSSGRSPHTEDRSPQDSPPEPRQRISGTQARSSHQHGRRTSRGYRAALAIRDAIMPPNSGASSVSGDSEASLASSATGHSNASVRDLCLYLSRLCMGKRTSAGNFRAFAETPVRFCRFCGSVQPATLWCRGSECGIWGSKQV